jgi:hypothetical protein
MFRTKTINSTIARTPKSPKHDNVLVNVVVVFSIRNQQSK